MTFLASVPKRNHQIGIDQQSQVFADALAGDVEMATKLVESLSVIAVKLIQQRAARGISQGFKHGVHWVNMQPKGCILPQTHNGSFKIILRAPPILTRLATTTSSSGKASGSRNR